jgi:hypothetical protein
MGMSGARRLSRMLHNLQNILSIELLCAAKASIFLSRYRPARSPSKPTRGAGNLRRFLPIALAPTSLPFRTHRRQLLREHPPLVRAAESDEFNANASSAFSESSLPLAMHDPEPRIIRVQSSSQILFKSPSSTSAENSQVHEPILRAVFLQPAIHFENFAPLLRGQSATSL